MFRNSRPAGNVKSSLGPSQVVDMVRNHEPLSENEAVAYASQLTSDLRRAKSGCYCVKCVRGCNLPVSCGYFCSCGDLLCPALSTIPFGCFIPIIYVDSEASYTNMKGDTLVVKVDEENETLACFVRDCGSVCCYCEKM